MGRYFTAHDARVIEIARTEPSKKIKKLFSRRIKEIVKQGSDHAEFDIDGYKKTWRVIVKWLESLGYTCCHSARYNKVYIYWNEEDLK